MIFNVFNALLTWCFWRLTYQELEHISALSKIHLKKKKDEKNNGHVKGMQLK